MRICKRYFCTWHNRW